MIYRFTIFKPFEDYISYSPNMEYPYEFLNQIGGSHWTSLKAQEHIKDIEDVLNDIKPVEYIGDYSGDILNLHIYKEFTEVSSPIEFEEIPEGMKIPTIEILKLMEDFRDFLISQGV